MSVNFNNVQQVGSLLNDPNAVSGHLSMLPRGVAMHSNPIPWVRRFCVLSMGAFFVFASSATSEFELDRLVFGSGSRVLSIVNSLGSSSPLAFEVCDGSGRSWILSTQNKSSKNSWIDMINAEIGFVGGPQQSPQMSPMRTATPDDDIMSAQEKVRRLQQQLEMAQRQLGATSEADDIDFHNRFSQATTLTADSFNSGPVQRDSGRTMSTYSGGSGGGSARQSIASAVRSDGGGVGAGGSINVGVRGGGVFGGDYHSDDEDSSSRSFFGKGERKKSISGSSGGNVVGATVVPKKGKSAKVQMSMSFVQY
ncbi:UNVERIFIED_CONTAM: hypothetical protein HDU68_010037 [Siphonaria sp. JEL0065]|nr:hypothetical protein HDU68_010037 [Siphonaria sp. JEL0065]